MALPPCTAATKPYDIRVRTTDQDEQQFPNTGIQWYRLQSRGPAMWQVLPAWAIIEGHLHFLDNITLYKIDETR